MSLLPALRHLLLPAAALALTGALVLAQTGGETAPADPHAGHDMAAMAGATPATLAYLAANASMHAGMDIAFTGNADVDFVAGMIPHHQGAVDMARIVLQHGTDPQVRAFAETIIAAQEAEIAWMRDWLAAQGN